MSVALISKRELEDVAGSLHRHLQNSGYKTRAGYEMEDAYRTLAVAGIANRTALFLTYGGGDDWDDARDLNTVPGALSAQATYDRIGNILYNCVSNDGTDCMPPRYHKILDWMRQSILQNAAGWRRA